jgi:hypothetical protein
MTAFATGIELCSIDAFQGVVALFSAAAAGKLEVLPAAIVPAKETLTLQQRRNRGLDRLLRDIERFEEIERWDGLS